MDRNLSVNGTTTPGDDQNMSQRAACPGCHTPHPSLAPDGLAAGVSWKCTRCGQRWDARRLASVAAYKAWATAYEAATRSAIEDATATARG